MKEKICVFDLDGTLLNTLDSIAYYVNKTLCAHGLGSVPTEKVREFIGHGARNLLTRCIGYSGGSAENLDEILAEYVALYDSDATYLVKPYEGIMPLLEKLHKSGVKIAVLSNKPHSSTKDIIEKLFERDLFYKYEGQREGIPIKPDPTSTLAIIKGFDKDCAFYIGDSPSDVKTAQNASVHSIAVTWGFRSRAELLAANPEFIVDTPQEIADIVLR